MFFILARLSSAGRAVTLLSRRPPPVQYGLRRSSLLGVALGSVVFMSGMLVGGWMVLGSHAAVLFEATVCALWLVAAGGALHYWLRQPRGMLQFDGHTWTLHHGRTSGTSQALSGPPEVVLDLQAHLWVRIMPSGDSPLWLWLERSSQPERWMDLRRAVYSRATPDVDNVDETARQAAAGREF